MTSFLTPFRRSLALALVAVSIFIAGCMPTDPNDPAQNPQTIMGPSALTAGQLWWYFELHQPPDGPLLTTTMEDLTQLFINQGIVEGIRGDYAFAQSIIETGWFRYGGQVDWKQNNFSGIGAVDGGDGGATFQNAGDGVRAQMQHLRAYADPKATKCAVPPLYSSCVDPRFDNVDPKGKAPTWGQMGNGNWATDPAYAIKIIGLYNQMRTYFGLPPV